jgi:hypothetical protein
VLLVVVVSVGSGPGLVLVIVELIVDRDLAVLGPVQRTVSSPSASAARRPPPTLLVELQQGEEARDDDQFGVGVGDERPERGRPGRGAAARR